MGNSIDAINEPSFKILGETHRQAIDIFNKEILGKAIDEFWDFLANYQHMFARLGDSQSKMSDKLSDEYIRLNALLFDEAIDYTNAGTFSDADMPMRVPGERMILLAESYNLDNDALTARLGEKFVTLRPRKEFADTLKMLLHCDITVKGFHLEFDTDEKNVEETLAVSTTGKVEVTNFKLEQQIAGVPIITEFNQPPKNIPSTSRQTSQSSSQRNDFRAEFTKIEELIKLDDYDYYQEIESELESLERRAKNQRDAAALNKIADYYQRIGEYTKASACKYAAEKF